jgi:hypothetical protein
MSNPTACPVEAAYNHGDTQGEGAGFWLVLTMRDGTEIKGPGYAPKNGVVQINRWGAEEAEAPHFIRCADVMRATIEW